MIESLKIQKNIIDHHNIINQSYRDTKTERSSQKRKNLPIIKNKITNCSNH